MSIKPMSLSDIFSSIIKMFFYTLLLNHKKLSKKLYKDIKKEITKYYTGKRIEIWTACTIYNTNRRSKNTLSFINNNDILQYRKLFLYITLPYKYKQQKNL